MWRAPRPAPTRALDPADKPAPRSAVTADPARLLQDAIAALGRRDIATAKQLAGAVLAARPRDPNALQVLGLAALEAGDAAGAKTALQQAAAAAPDHPPILNALGVALRRLGEIEPARQALSRAGARGHAEAWRNLGNLEDSENRIDAAVAAYANAVAAAPRDAASLAALADLHERRHDLAAAKTHADAALAIDPRNARAAIARARLLLRARDFAGAEAAALALAESGAASRTNRALAWGLVGEARDRRGDAAGAFAAFTAANRLQREDHAALRDARDHLYHPESVRRLASLPPSGAASSVGADAPVFLIGFPRSGTTLLDQILASHRDVRCIEEAPHFAAAVAEVIGLARLYAPDAIAKQEVASIRAAYWRRTGVRAPRLVDKLPLNIILLPLIRRVFPDARIIVALRDPRDVILSCYQQRFGMNAAMVQFLELRSAVDYYDLVMALYMRWRPALGAALCEVRYESVVGDLEAEARRLAAFLDLPFDPAMLDFQSTARARDIATPSARQVIEPLYARSISRWRRYQSELAPILPPLNVWAARLGYR